ncbi:MAG: tRNA-(ms[2]io[6]A)-hydroxylase [Pirellulales bacterium]
MLSLKSRTPARWLAQVETHLDEVLIDHAHCEKKAASAAMNLLFAYVDQVDLARAMTEIVVEELEHFNRVLGLLEARGVPFRRIKPSNYGQQLHALIRLEEPGRAIDRLLVAGLIEARSCERFGLLREHLPDKTLAKFYDDLFESEARHHSTYVQLARKLGSEEEIRERLDALATAEAEIIERGDRLPRMHS